MSYPREPPRGARSAGVSQAARLGMQRRPSGWRPRPAHVLGLVFTVVFGFAGLGSRSASHQSCEFGYCTGSQLCGDAPECG